MPVKKIWKTFKASVTEFFAARVLKLSASLSYSTIFALPGLLIIIIWISDLFYGHSTVEGSIFSQMADFIGADAAAQVKETIKNASASTGNRFTTIVGLTTLIIGAS